VTRKFHDFKTNIIACRRRRRLNAGTAFALSRAVQVDVDAALDSSTRE
jgi:hypothetical protein